MAEQVYRGHYEPAQSVLPCQQQDQFLAKLHEEFGQCLVRARLHGTMGTAQSLSQGKEMLGGLFFDLSQVTFSREWKKGDGQAAERLLPSEELMALQQMQ